MTDATNHDPQLDPDRAKFTIALNAARDQVVQADRPLGDERPVGVLTRERRGVRW